MSQPTTRYSLPQELLFGAMNVLLSRPAGEVLDLVNGIRQEIEKQNAQRTETPLPTLPTGAQ